MEKKEIEARLDRIKREGYNNLTAFYAVHDLQWCIHIIESLLGHQSVQITVLKQYREEHWDGGCRGSSSCSKCNFVDGIKS